MPQRLKQPARATKGKRRHDPAINLPLRQFGLHRYAPKLRASSRVAGTCRGRRDRTQIGRSLSCVGWSNRRIEEEESTE